jgi:hypothetical protein
MPPRFGSRNWRLSFQAGEVKSMTASWRPTTVFCSLTAGVQ